MSDHAPLKIVSPRQRAARILPEPVRKAYRMVENYFTRMRLWFHVFVEFQPVGKPSKAILLKSLAFAPFTALARPDSFQPPRLLADIDVALKGIGRFHIRAHTDDILHVLSAREPKIRELIETVLPVGGTFVDAGANIGFYTVLAANRVGDVGRVIAFEMMPDTANVLQRHVALNNLNQVNIIERALSDTEGKYVSASVEPGVHGQASIVPIDQKAGRTIIEVETTTLDNVLRTTERIDLIKMDLEGAELLALQGGGATLAKTGCIVFESNAEDRRIFELLENAGFAIERLEGHDFVALRRSDKPVSKGGN